MIRLHRLHRAALVAVGALVFVVGCSTKDEPASDGRLTVAAAFFPIEEIVRQVGGDAINVVTLVPPGEDAHEYEPTPQQVARLEQADVVFYLGGGFQPGVEKVIAGLPDRVVRVDLLEGLTLRPVTDQPAGSTGTTAGETLDGDLDPHVWLDPANMQAMTDAVAPVLSAARPDDAATFTANANSYRAALGALDQRMTAGLASCTSPVIVTAHRAFVYLASAYGLTQIPIAGISPNDEPSAKTLAAVAEAADASGARTIYFEENLPADLARTVADEIGATTGVLDTAESLSRDQIAAGDTYISVMDRNLAARRDGLGCR